MYTAIMFVYLLFLLTRAMSDGDTESIMVFTSIIWAVYHDINLELILIMIAVHMINMASHQVSSRLDQLSESKIFQHCCDLIFSLTDKAQIQVPAHNCLALCIYQSLQFFRQAGIICTLGSVDVNDIYFYS